MCQSLHGGMLTFCLLLAKEALGHFSEEFLGRAGGVELWHHHTAAGGKFVRSEALREKRHRKNADEKVKYDVPYCFSAISRAVFPR